jgi:hypothetical protein
MLIEIKRLTCPVVLRNAVRVGVMNVIFINSRGVTVNPLSLCSLIRPSRKISQETARWGEKRFPFAWGSVMQLTI